MVTCRLLHRVCRILLPLTLVSAGLVRADSPAQSQPAASQPAGLLPRAPEGKKLRIACVGDGAAREYPAFLARMLGKDYEVQAFCTNDHSVLRTQLRSVWKRREGSQALASRPDVVLLMFEHAAGRLNTWHADKGRFAQDYKDYLARFAALPTKPAIFLCLPPPPRPNCFYGIDADTVNSAVVPAVRQIALDLKLPLIDTHTPMLGRVGLMGGDGVFPTPQGAARQAAIIYTALTGLQPPPLPELADAGDPAALAPTKPDQPTPGWKDRPMPPAVSLAPADVLNPKGDGPDGKPNTADDTWGFWAESAKTPTTFERLEVFTASLSPEARAKAPAADATGPAAAGLPHPDATDGWIAAASWDSRRAGVWADRTANAVYLYPTIWNKASRCVAVTWTVPATGVYTISGAVRDADVVSDSRRCNGVRWSLEVSDAGGPGVPLAKGGPVGDRLKGSNVQPFKLDSVPLGGGKLLRLSIDPFMFDQSDLTCIELRIEKAAKP